MAEAKQKSKLSKGLSKAGEAMQAQGQAQMERVAEESEARSDEKSPNSQPRMDSYKRGGKVRKTGKARLHKGEIVQKRKKKGRKRGRI